MSKKVNKTYKSCDNQTDDENSVEGDNNYKIANKIKQGKYGGKNIGKTKRYDKKEKYERYEDLSSDWEEVKDDKGLDKFKEKMMKRYVKEGINKVLNPKTDKYKLFGNYLDDEDELEEESEEEEESEVEDISALFKEEDEK